MADAIRNMIENRSAPRCAIILPPPSCHESAPRDGDRDNLQAHAPTWLHGALLPRCCRVADLAESAASTHQGEIQIAHRHLQTGRKLVYRKLVELRNNVLDAGLHGLEL